LSRFIVQEVHGWTIGLGTNNTGQNKRPDPVSFVVLDSGCCYQRMAEFPPGDGRNVGYNPIRRRRAAAEAFAAELNATHRP
jgi:hypothetical protein